MTQKLEILDSTLRDGAQGEGIAFSVEDKIKVCRLLDDLGVAYIEAGNPGSNQKDLEFFQRMAGENLKTSKLCAFGSTRRHSIKAQDDANVKSLLLANTPTVSIFGKAWDLHVTEILKTTLEENLAMITDTISYLKAQGKEVIFDAEHFFDGYKANPEYAMKALKAAADGGALVLCLCDTNGSGFYPFIASTVEKVVKAFPHIKVGIHCHNDSGLAVACTMGAVEAGAVHIQGTYVGFGERCGNANLSTIIPNLQLKGGYQCLESDAIAKLTPVARAMSEIANVPLSNAKPYVGNSAFAHKAGMHADGVKKLSHSFEHISPETVGNQRRFLMSEVAGRAAVLHKIQSVMPSIDKDSPKTAQIIARLKQLEYDGYQFEAAEQSFELVIRKELGLYTPFFQLINFKIIGEHPHDDEMYPSSAIIKVRVGNSVKITASEGDGPVHALDSALRKALSGFYPVLKKMRLSDYKVRVMEPRDATAAKVRVLIESTDGDSTWATVGVSTDIIEASWLALVDSIDYLLSK